MPISTILDVLLLVLLLGYLFSGYRSGLIGSLSGIVGLVAGAIAAYFLVPLVGSWVPAAEWRTAATLFVAGALLVGGLSVGGTIGRHLRPQSGRKRLLVVDRVLGAGAAVLVSATVVSMIAFSIGSLGVPLLSPAIASSNVVRSIDSLTPDSVKTFLAQLRAIVMTEGIPRVVEAFNGPVPDLPTVQSTGPELLLAQASVLKIVGTAYSCGQNQSGTGFVIAPGRVLTNAHVVAGVTEPVVETAEGTATPGRVVYFDPSADLAVIAVGDLERAPLALGENLAAGSLAISDGYPFGGPFEKSPAQIVAIAPTVVGDIYGDNPTPRSIYTLAADIDHGESGGPLLDLSGRVVGVVFAKSTVTANVGYALALDTVAPVVEKAAGLSDSVEPGRCIAG
jgi:S1-C subfamily serine protease